MLRLPYPICTLFVFLAHPLQVLPHYLGWWLYGWCCDKCLAAGVRYLCGFVPPLPLLDGEYVPTDVPITFGWADLIDVIRGW